MSIGDRHVSLPGGRPVAPTRPAAKPRFKCLPQDDDEETVSAATAILLLAMTSSDTLEEPHEPA
jgi:hypothetical protein